MRDTSNVGPEKKVNTLLAERASFIRRLLDTSIMLSLGSEDELDISAKLILLAHKKAADLEQEYRESAMQDGSQ
ncbi:TPA: hypothetical protein QFT03_002806 [Kluyvera ascorbata]|nr:hypothetical protein [Kluyvera ascorbata]